ncbi:murein biosynthesis integral membrane protein MurJ [bacterium]|nr:murein biosynthesis integral membrane protein MurJ [bacterium]
MHDKTEQKIKSSVAKSAIYFASGTLMSRLMGLVRDALLVAIFGKTISDAWLAAFRFPNLFRRIFGEGALSACFIPLYVEYKEKHDQKSLAQLTAGVLGLLLAVLIPITIFCILGMDSISASWVHGKGFAEVSGKVELTVQMTKIMFPFLLLMTLYAFLMAVLNAHKKFLLSSLAPLFFNLIIVMASLYCYWNHWVSAIFLSWSVIAGGVVQFVTLLPAFLKLKIPFAWQWQSLTSTPVRRVLNAFLPSVFGLGIIQFMGLVNISFASQLPEGAVTSIYLADRLLELPLSLVAVSLGTALLPTLSEHISMNNEHDFKFELFKNIKILMLLCVPASVGLWMTSSLVVSVLFERGAFTAEQGAIVSGITKIYAFTLIGASLTRILGQAFYAEKKTSSPAVAAFVGFIIHLLMAPFLMEKWGIYGLVISTSLSSFINCFVLLGWFYFRHGSLYFASLAAFLFKMVLASSAIVGVCWLQNAFYSPDTFLQKSMALVGVVLWSAVLFFLFAKILRVEEADWLLQKMVRRASKR